MEGRSTNIALGLLALLLVWVGVYWWWPTEPPISFAPASSNSPDNRQLTPASTLGGRTIEPLTAREDSSIESVQRVPGVMIPTFKDHTITDGETLQSISKLHFGSVNHADAIARANPMMSPLNLKPGRVIRIPIDPANVQGVPAERTRTVIGSKSNQPAPPAMKEYVVAKGDSLAKIARNFLGDESQAMRIFEANKDRLKSPEQIRLGQSLRIPPKDEPKNDDPKPADSQQAKAGPT